MGRAPCRINAHSGALTPSTAPPSAPRPPFALWQMVGRAGRPQFDTEGVAVIMTQRSTMQRYQALMTGSEDVESCLHHSFAEHLNAGACTVWAADCALQHILCTGARASADWQPGQHGALELSA